MSENDDEYFHEQQHDQDLHVQLPGYEQATVSFVGRPEFGSVTMYLMDPETNESLAPVFECDKELFEMLLEQASGALLNANNRYPQHPGLERDDEEVAADE